jgi:hypothetical protein
MSEVPLHARLPRLLTAQSRFLFLRLSPRNLLSCSLLARQQPKCSRSMDQTAIVLVDTLPIAVDTQNPPPTVQTRRCGSGLHKLTGTIQAGLAYPEEGSYLRLISLCVTQL